MAFPFGVHLQGTAEEYEIELKVMTQSDLLVLLYAHVVKLQLPAVESVKLAGIVQVQKGEALQKLLFPNEGQL